MDLNGVGVGGGRGGALSWKGSGRQLPCPHRKMGSSLQKNVPRNHTQRCSLLPELVVDCRGLGGLTLTLALEMSSVCP